MQKPAFNLTQYKVALGLKSGVVQSSPLTTPYGSLNY